jgi:hypothetical protein
LKKNSRKSGPSTQLDLFGRLRHIEQALAREIDLLTKYERTQVLPELIHARQIVRSADQRLTEIQENRRKKCKKTP